MTERYPATVLNDANAIMEQQADEIKRLRSALRNVQIEAEREKGSWVHLKRVIAVNCREALQQQVSSDTLSQEQSK